MPAELIRHLPLAKDVVLSARQEMVMRLDGYCEASRELFEEVRWLVVHVDMCGISALKGSWALEQHTHGWARHDTGSGCC
jgi:hypothetical protein